MPFTFVMLPPQTDLTRDWGRRLTASTFIGLGVFTAVSGSRGAQ